MALVAEHRNCRARFPEQHGTCLASASQQEARVPDYIFIGDSHAEALAGGFIAAHRGLDVLAFGKAGCPPLPGVERFDEKGAIGCTETYNAFFAALRDGHYQDSVVVISARHAFYVDASGFGDVDAMYSRPGSVHIQPAGPRLDRTLVNYGVVYENGLRELLAMLLPHVRAVVFSHQVPELGFHPERCVPRWQGMQPASCAVSRTVVRERQRGYREAVGRVLREFPAVIVADPVETLCDADACRPVRAGKMMYHDDDHLGLLGAAEYSRAILGRLP